MLAFGVAPIFSLSLSLVSPVVLTRLRLPRILLARLLISLTLLAWILMTLGVVPLEVPVRLVELVVVPRLVRLGAALGEVPLGVPVRLVELVVQKSYKTVTPLSCRYCRGSDYRGVSRSHMMGTKTPQNTAKLTLLRYLY